MAHGRTPVVESPDCSCELTRVPVDRWAEPPPTMHDDGSEKDPTFMVAYSRNPHGWSLLQL